MRTMLLLSLSSQGEKLSRNLLDSLFDVVKEAMFSGSFTTLTNEAVTNPSAPIDFDRAEYSALYHVLRSFLGAGKQQVTRRFIQEYGILEFLDYVEKSVCTNTSIFRNTVDCDCVNTSFEL